MKMVDEMSKFVRCRVAMSYMLTDEGDGYCHGKHLRPSVVVQVLQELRDAGYRVSNFHPARATGFVLEDEGRACTQGGNLNGYMYKDDVPVISVKELRFALTGDSIYE